MAPHANIFAIQIFNIDASGLFGASSAAVDLALQEVIDSAEALNVSAVNLSIGADGYSAACDEEFAVTKGYVDALRELGVTTVASSGNNSAGTAGKPAAVGFPACISSVVAVGSTTKTDQIASSSNRSSLVDLYAPGKDITSALLGGKMGSKSGTSMAAPHVAGAVAVLRSRTPDLMPDEIVQRLKDSGTPIPDSVLRISTPRINVEAATP